MNLITLDDLESLPLGENKALTREQRDRLRITVRYMDGGKKEMEEVKGASQYIPVLQTLGH